MASVFITMNCGFFNDLIIIATRKASQARVELVTATITMLYLLTVAQLAIQWQLLQLSFVDSGETHETIFINNIFTGSLAWVTLALGSCIAATRILADGLLVSTTSFTISFSTL